MLYVALMPKNLHWVLYLTIPRVLSYLLTYPQNRLKSMTQARNKLLLSQKQGVNKNITNDVF